MARQTFDVEPTSRTTSQRLPAVEDSWRNVNTARRRQGEAGNDIVMNSGNRRPVCVPNSTAKSARISNINSPGDAAAPHALNVDERLRLVRERREERERQLVSKELGWQVREERARRYHEEQLEERKRRLMEHRLKEERRRHAVEEKRKQKLKEEKERYESAVRRTLERSQRAKQRLSQNSRGRKLIRNNAPRRFPLTSWEEKLVSRLLTPTCSYLARSKSSACQSSQEVSCHSVKANVTHEAQHHSVPVKHSTTTAPNSHRTVHRSTTQAQKANAEQRQRKEKKTCSSRTPQTASANLGAGPPTNPPNRSASPSPRRSHSKSVIRQMELSTVPEEDLLDNPTPLPPRNSQAKTMAAVYYQTDTEGNMPLNSPQTASMIRNVQCETPPLAVTSRPPAGTTDPEEASRLLAEKRREARQQREREEEERLRREEMERRGREELERRRAEVRAQKEAAAQRLMVERKRREEEEQRRARAEESRKAMEEAALLQKEREEDLARQQEKAEQLRLEREKVFQKEEAERQARKKRLEEIMKRTRKTDPEKKPAPTESLLKEAQPEECMKQSSRTEVVMQPSLHPGVEDMMPVVAFKDRRSLRTLSGLEEIQAHHRAEVI